MKYKVGDVVRVRDDLEAFRMYGKYELQEEQEVFYGVLAVIKRVDEINDYYNLDIDNEKFYWSDEMLEKGKSMKYKVGDKVRVRKDLEKEKEYGLHIFDAEMEEYKGKQAIIKRVLYTSYVLNIDNSIYCWTDEMLEPIAEPIAESDEIVDTSVETIDKSNQFTIDDFKFGDIVTTAENRKFIFIKNKLENEIRFVKIDSYSKKLNNIYNHDLDIIKVERIIENRLELIFERKEILNEKEKEYLSAVIKPFREEIKYIKKCDVGTYGFMQIALKQKQPIEFPYLKDETYYAGMIKGIDYTLKQLEL